MQEYEVICLSHNKPLAGKKIFIYVVEPSVINAETGLMHFAHGWGCNRYAYRDMQREFADRFNMVCICTEYRQSGYWFDPISGAGSDVPYDASHYQVIDCLNACRKILALYPALNRRRLVSFGASQGGHIAMLMSIFCPHTFACVISLCGISHVDAKTAGWAGRDFSEDELYVRDVVKMAGRVQCPVAIAHGTADDVVDVAHTRLLEQALKAACKTVRSRYIEGGGHAMQPVTDRKSVALEMASDWIESMPGPESNDFDARSKVEIPCVSKTLVLDWSKAMDDGALMAWEPIGA